MVFINLSSGELCRHLKDKDENHGMSLDALLRHVTSDKLVLWGWNPGVGRETVSVPHQEFVAKFKTWIAAGAPCAVAPRQRGICAPWAHRRATRPDAASIARLIRRKRFAPAARGSSPLGDSSRRDRGPTPATQAFYTTEPVTP